MLELDLPASPYKLLGAVFNAAGGGRQSLPSQDNTLNLE